MTESHLAVLNSRFALIAPGKEQSSGSPTMDNFKVKGRKIADIVWDVNEILKEFGVQEEEGLFHDSTRHDRLAPKAWPDVVADKLRWVACYPVRGSNEGLYVHIDLIFQPNPYEKIEPNRRLLMIATAKCYSWAWATNVAGIVSRIFEGEDSWKRRDDIWG